MITDQIRRAREAQAEHDRRVPVQLQIDEHPTLWATYEELVEEMRRTTFDHPGNGAFVFSEVA